MKVLQSCLSNSWGGMEMVVVDTAADLISSGIEAKILCPKSSKISKEAARRNIETFPINTTGYINFSNIKNIYEYIKNENFNILHSHASKDLWTLAPSLSGVNKSIPLIFSKHVGSFISKKDVFHNIIYKRVDRALAISNVIRNNLIATTPLPSEKITVLYNGIDLERFNPERVTRSEIRSEFKVDDEEILIGMTARFTPGKGHIEFLEAADILNSKYNYLKFLIIGEASYGEEKYYRKIMELTESSSLSGKVIFTGFRTNIPEILSALDIFAFPSHSEAFGLSLVEAMAMGIPSVATNSDGVLDIMLDNETGFLFEKKNSLDLAEKIEILISDEEKRENFGIASRKRVEKIFDKRNTVPDLIRIYEKEIAKVKRTI